VTSGCNESADTIPLALTAANGNGKADTIVFGGPQNDGPYTLNGGAEGLLLVGSGPNAVISLPSGPIQTYLSVSNATVRGFTIAMNAVSSSNDTGIQLSGGATADQVTVNGAGADNASGISVTNGTVSSASVLMDIVSNSGTSGIRGFGGATVLDTTVTAGRAFSHSGATPDTLDRLTLRAGDYGVTVDSGTVNIADSVIDLGARPAVGLSAGNFNGGDTTETVNADHVTIVGGSAGSRGVEASATILAGKKDATVNLANSIIRGPETSLVAEATNNGAQGGPSTATVNVAYTDYQSTSNPNLIGANGTGGVVVGTGNVVGTDPGFASPATSDYRLTPGSPLVDKGDPAPGGPPQDRDGTARVVDGDAVAGARRDMGAYELHDSTAPETTISSGPSGVTSDPTPTFAFTSEPGATFECKIDAAAFAACTSPLTTPSLADGAHVFSVRAKDAASNVDATPATRSFTVDTTAPDTTITKKPAKRTTKAKVKLVFSSEAGATFQCQVDGQAWKACTSPLKLKVKLGKHVVLVRAIDAAGNTDATPAKVKFKRVAKPR